MRKGIKIKPLNIIVDICSKPLYNIK